LRSVLMTFFDLKVLFVSHCYWKTFQ